MYRMARIQAGIGAAAWLVLLAAGLPAPDLPGRIARLLLLAILVLMPLVLALAAMPDRSGRHPLAWRAAMALYPLAAGCAAASFLVPSGPSAAFLATPWLVLTGLVAFCGLMRLLGRGLVYAEEVCIDAGLLFVPVGAAWLFAARADLTVGQFNGPIVLLTAAHFHVAGCVAPIFAGMTGRRLLADAPAARRWFWLIAAGLLMGLPLVAAGITASPFVEICGVLVFTLSLAALAWIVLRRILPGCQHRTMQVLLGLSAISLPVTMGFAVVYGIGEILGQRTVSWSTMVQFHGWLNTFGFSLLGAVAWHLGPPASLVRQDAVADSR